MTPEELKDVVNKYKDLTFQVAEDTEERYYCELALRFRRWVNDKLLSEFTELGKREPIGLLQAKIMLQDGYFSLVNYAVSIEHKSFTPPGGGKHICIYQVYVEAYSKIQEKLLFELPPRVLEKDALANYVGKPKTQAVGMPDFYPGSTPLGEVVFDQ